MLAKRVLEGMFLEGTVEGRKVEDDGTVKASLNSQAVAKRK